MLSSNSSDTVLRPPLGGYRKGKIPARGRTVLPKEIENIRPQQAREPLPSPNSCKSTGPDCDSSRPSDHGHEGHKGVTIPEEDDMEELERLRKEILLNAHRAAMGNNDATASPELLATCRDGPGTYMFSPEYQEIEIFRVVPQDDTPDYSNLPGALHVFSTEEAKNQQLPSELDSRLGVCRELYHKTPRVYPVIREGNLELSTVADKSHERILRKVNNTQGHGLSSPWKADIKVINRSRKKRTVQEHAWSDKHIMNWEYIPHIQQNNPDLSQDHKPVFPEWFRARFQSWLDDTIPPDAPPTGTPLDDTIPTNHLVDIYHEAFFHGTAHADGENSMIILDMRKYEALLDLTDKKTRDHAHETAAGYAYNFSAQMKKAEDEEHHRKEMDRKVRLEALHSPRLRSPSSPVANIYLRPVENKDVPELQEIHNWYARNSTRSPYTTLGSDQIHERIETCRNAQLPFIIAVDRRSASSRRPEKILGYALAKEFDNSAYAARHTAELEVFVKERETNQGIGKCLLDKLLEVCDPLYCPNGGYEFQASTDDRSAYYPGGRRRLARLVFTLSYVDNGEVTEHKRVKKWLEQNAGFEEQGLLRGVRVRGTEFVNVAYLVRNTGHSGTDKWEP
ncbi:hypothetical protein BJY01DRAFT_225121 [Aspergillus pseudoustus]|uniref:N-acetyltransferase domain-containing protein n=1 Tax=Aspergillus pseudoustus TaxID=1810923 RepID=A0ABR4J0V4_9EURO